MGQIRSHVKQDVTGKRAAGELRQQMQKFICPVCSDMHGNKVFEKPSEWAPEGRNCSICQSNLEAGATAMVAKDPDDRRYFWLRDERLAKLAGQVIVCSKETMDALEAKVKQAEEKAGEQPPTGTGEPA